MKQVLMALAMLLAFAPVANAQTADAAYGVRYDAQALVLNLPQDAAKSYLTVIGNPDDKRFQTVAGWFDGNEQLRVLKGASHFNAIPTTSAMYRERYSQSVRGTPCIRIQDAAGQVLYEVCGRNIPMSPEALTRAINASGCLRRNYPAPAPDDDPPPQPLDPGPPPPQPVEQERFPWLLLVGLTVAGAIAGLVKQFKDTYSAKPLK